MLIYEEPTSVAHAEVILDDLCAQSDKVMFPSNNREKSKAKYQRRKINAYFDRLISFVARQQPKADWKDVYDGATTAREKLVATKEAIRDLESIW
jgi:hypothetical protein